MVNNFSTADGMRLRICTNVQNRIILKFTKFQRDCVGKKKVMDRRPKKWQNLPPPGINRVKQG